MKKHASLWMVALFAVVAAVWFISHSTRSRPSQLPNANAAERQATRPASSDKASKRHQSNRFRLATKESPLGNNAENTDVKLGEVCLYIHSNNTEKAGRSESETDSQSTPEAPAVGDLDPEIAQASAEFKRNAGLGLRPLQARKLFPHLKEGMSKPEVEFLLGEPSKIYDNGLRWWYIVFYSQYIDIYFNGLGRVRHIDACVTTNVGDKVVGQTE